MNYDKILAALELRVQEVSGIPVVAYENVKFDPKTGTPFVRTRFIPISRTQKTVGVGADNKPFWLDYKGIFQLVLYMPESEGQKATNDLVNAICDKFEAATDLEFDGVYVTINKVERARGINETPWFKTPVSVYWQSFSK